MLSCGDPSGTWHFVNVRLSDFSCEKKECEKDCR